MGKLLNIEILFWFHKLIKKDLYPSKKSLMEKFEIKSRTAQRAIEFIRDRLKAPIKYSREKGGYYYSDKSFDFPRVQFTEQEIMGLIISERLTNNTIPNEKILEAFNSFIEKFTLFTGIDINKLKKRISIKNIRYDKVESEVFESVIKALNDSQKLKIDYRSKYKDEITSRIINPLHLLLYMGNWHLFAFCELRKELRNFALSGILKIEIYNQSILDNLKHLDIGKLIEDNYGIYIHDDEVDKVDVVLKFNKEISEIVKTQIWFPHQQQEQKDDDSIVLSFPVTDFREILGDILKYGPNVEVLEPMKLKKLVKNTILKMTKLY